MYAVIYRNKRTAESHVTLSGADEAEARQAKKRLTSFLSKEEKEYISYSVRLEE